MFARARVWPRMLALVALGVPLSGSAQPRVLVFSRTEGGYRHEAIEVATEALRGAAADRGWTLDATEDPAMFDAVTLERYDVAVFLLTSADVLDDARQASFEAWLTSGDRGWVGVHSASSTELGWPFYGRVVGAVFQMHSVISPNYVLVEDGAHPATAHLPSRWLLTDEWYEFMVNPRDHVRVLLRMDPTEFGGRGPDADYPIAWCHVIDGARSFYTAMGHMSEEWRDPAFVAHVAGGIAYAAGIAPADCTPRPLGSPDADAGPAAHDAGEPDAAAEDAGERRDAAAHDAGERRDAAAHDAGQRHDAAAHDAGPIADEAARDAGSTPDAARRASDGSGCAVTRGRGKDGSVWLAAFALLLATRCRRSRRRPRRAWRARVDVERDRT